MTPADQLDPLFRWALAHDLALFPILSGHKRPTGIVKSHANDWSKEESRWREWYASSGGCNFGVSCGPSRVIVVDRDPGGEEKFAAWARENSSVTPVLTVKTPSGGDHYYFKVPAGVDSETLRQPNLCGKEVNVRAGHGYVVAPLSFTDPKLDEGVKALGYYVPHHWGIIPDAPRALVEHCLPVSETAPVRPVSRPPPEFAPAGRPGEFGADGLPVSGVDRPEAIRRWTTIVDRLRKAVPGERNEKLNNAALAVGKMIDDGMVDETSATHWLELEAASLGLPRDEARATVRSGVKAGKTKGYPEPRSALMELLATSVPVAPLATVALLPKRKRSGSLVPDEPLVERLLYRGAITYLSGHSGTGKTTLLASLLAASVADVQHFNFGLGDSDAMMLPSCWIFISYEGGQYIERTKAAWHAGSGMTAKFPGRVETIEFDDGCLISTNSRREVVVNEKQAAIITGAVTRMREANPGMPVVLVVDNATTAVENCMDVVQAGAFAQAMRGLANMDLALVILAHPPKTGSSDIFGSHVYYSLADIVGVIEVLREEAGEWIQWIDFSKHRPDKNSKCLELRSRRMATRLVELPPEWGHGHAQARRRQEESLRVPYIHKVRVMDRRDRETIEKGVREVTAKPVAETPATDWMKF